MPTLLHLRAALARTTLRQPLVWLRNLGLSPSDVFLASYPRSGNTMLRFLLAETITGCNSTFDNIQRTIPDLGVHVGAKVFLSGHGRLIKTHERYRSSYQRAIYIVRDVRDVLLSNYGRETSLDVIQLRSLDRYVLLFMQGKMTLWHSWQRHVTEWLDSPLSRSGNLHLVRFEEMRADLLGTICKAMEFLGLSWNLDTVERAIANNSLEKMRIKEDSAARLARSPEEHGRWIGQGKVFGWRDKLTPEQLVVVDKYAKDLLLRLGYETGEAYLARRGSDQLGHQSCQIGSLLPVPPRAPVGTLTAGGEWAPLLRNIGGRVARRFCWYRH